MRIAWYQTNVKLVRNVGLFATAVTIYELYGHLFEV